MRIKDIDARIEQLEDEIAKLKLIKSWLEQIRTYSQCATCGHGFYETDKLKCSVKCSNHEEWVNGNLTKKDIDFLLGGRR